MILHSASHEPMNSTLSFLGMAFFILNEYRSRSVRYLIPLYSAYSSLVKCIDLICQEIGGLAYQEYTVSSINKPAKKFTERKELKSEGMFGKCQKESPIGA